MGASGSTVVLGQETSLYKGSKLLQTYSSNNFEDVLRLYEVEKQHSINDDQMQVERLVEESLFSTQDFNDDVFAYVIVLVNQHSPQQCFSISRLDSRDEAEKKIEELFDLLMPYIDKFPSLYSPEHLTSLVKLRSSYPSWSVQKVAEYLKFPETVNLTKQVHPKFSRQQSQHHQETLELIKREQPSFARDFFGSTPLQFLSEIHPELVIGLVAAIDSLAQTGKDFKDGFDNISKYTESPIHVAIRLSQDSALKMLLEKGVNPFIPCGHAYPIHLAMKHKSHGCLKLLLEHDNKCLEMKDKKYNGSALHWVKSSNQIDLLTRHDAVDLNERNFENETALHIMVKRQRLGPCASLICHGANINAKGKDGATPLHYSILKCDIDIVRALLFLGADRSIKDNCGKTAVDYLTKDCENYHDIVDLLELFSYHHTQKVFTQKRSQSILKEKTGREALLCLDGGGIRGLVLTEVLFAVESVTGCSIYDLFDWISGTSTGSFLGLSVANGRSIRSCQLAYLRLGRSCLTGIRPYPTELLDQFLINEFGKDTKMDAIDFPHVIIPATVADRRPATLHLFRNYNAPYDEQYQMRDARFPRPPLPPDQTVWLALRSSCSAPSYFRSTGRYLDGGLIANNPTLDALSEIHKHEKYFDTVDKKKKDGRVTNLKVVVSVGTGKPPLKALRPIDIYRPSSVWDTAEIVDNLKGFVDLMIDQVSMSDDHVMDRARSWCEMTNIDYFRLQPTMSSEIELNETDDRVLLTLLCDVRKYVLNNMDQVKRLGDLLLGKVL